MVQNIHFQGKTCRKPISQHPGLGKGLKCLQIWYHTFIDSTSHEVSTCRTQKSDVFQPVAETFGPVQTSQPTSSWLSLLFHICFPGGPK